MSSLKGLEILCVGDERETFISDVNLWFFLCISIKKLTSKKNNKSSKIYIYVFRIYDIFDLDGNDGMTSEFSKKRKVEFYYRIFLLDIKVKSRFINKAI